MQVLDLDFGLLSDWNAEAVRGFGVGRSFRALEEVARRTAFLIGADGVIRGAWSYEDDEVPDYEPLIAAARSL
jgi:peroxiredoxin